MTGKEILANLNKPTIYIGVVTEIYDADSSDKDALKEPNSIKFTIPGVTDGIVKYPVARLIGNRTRRVEKDDTVFIIKQGSFNNIFFYMPMDISDFIGCAYDKDHKISLVDNNINIKSGDSSITVGDDGVTITDGKDSIKVSDGKINISTGNSKINLSSTDVKSDIEISVANNTGTQSTISLSSLPALLNLGVTSGGMIILPTGPVGFSTGVGPASATLPVLTGTAPIITIPAIITVVVTSINTQNAKVKLSNGSTSIEAEPPNGTVVAFNEGDVINISYEPQSPAPTIKFNGSTITSGSITATTGTLNVEFS